MTATKRLIKDLITIKQKLNDIIEIIGQYEDSLIGMELMYKGNYANIMTINGHTQRVCLYIEDEGGKSWEEYISLDEILKIID